MNEQNQRIIDRLIQWGCNVQGAMPRFLNSTDMYCLLLRSVPEQDDFEALGNALNAGDKTATFEKAHALKGVLANMSLTPMYTEVCEIVELLRSGTMEGVSSHYEKLMQEKTVLQDILSEKS